jgi:putative oxidoreductase
MTRSPHSPLIMARANKGLPGWVVNPVSHSPKRPIRAISVVQGTTGDTAWRMRKTLARTSRTLLPLAGRLLLVAEFLIAVNGKISGWSGQATFMASRGMTMVQPLLAAALAIEALGSVCLILGLRTRTAAAAMFVYLGVVSVRLHDFWNMSDMAAANNETHFFKNLGMMGGLLLLAAYGPGRWSLDAKKGRSISP